MTVGEKIENIVGKNGVRLSNTDCIVLAFTREEWFKKWNQEKFMQEASSCPLCERPLQALLLVTPQEPKWIPVSERLPELRRRYEGGRGMTREENIKAILECNFAGFKEEIINIATKRICELEQEPMIEIDLYSVIKQKYIEREVLEKLRADIEATYDELDGYDPDALGTFASRIDDLIDNLLSESEVKANENEK